MRSLVFSLLVGAAAFAETPQKTVPAAAAPVAQELSCKGCNVILISLDTLRADELSTYGYSRDTSPHIDALAARGTLFLNTFSQFPSTLPSHMSIFTSQYPWRHRVRSPGAEKLDPKTTTLPMVFHANGYRTVWAAVKMDPYLGLAAGFARGFDDFVQPKDPHGDWTTKAIRWIRRHRKQRFFMFLHSYKPHDPYEPQRASALHYLVKLDPSKKWPSWRRMRWADGWIWSDPNKVTMDRHNAFASRFDKNNPKDVEYLRGLYDGSVHDTDADVQKLVGALENLGLSDRTLLVLTSDHGEEFMEHGRLFHSQDRVELTHVPLIFVFPGGAPGGQRFPQLARSIDILPTILDAARLPPPDGLEGRSLLPLIEGKTNGGADYAFAQSLMGYSARDDRYTYLAESHCPGSVFEAKPDCASERLFDRSNDPHEQRDIAASSPEAVSRLRHALVRQLEIDRAGPAEAWIFAMPEERRRKAMETGYW